MGESDVSPPACAWRPHPSVSRTSRLGLQTGVKLSASCGGPWQNAKMWAEAGEAWGSQLLCLRSGTKPSEDALGASVFPSAGSG